MWIGNAFCLQRLHEANMLSVMTHAGADTTSTLTDDLIHQAKMTPAAALGRKGGSSTARKLGAEHYRKLAATRKTHAGGKPRKSK